uniref:Uncharacterized protein n=1 Tax=Leersia perrieri TaxID=77586 RepID=A0A0D9VRF4_9ORYZ
MVKWIGGVRNRVICMSKMWATPSPTFPTGSKTPFRFARDTGGKGTKAIVPADRSCTSCNWDPQGYAGESTRSGVGPPSNRPAHVHRRNAAPAACGLLTPTYPSFESLKALH